MVAAVTTPRGSRRESGDVVGGFVAVPSEVDLALVVGFMPGHEEDGFGDGAFGGAEHEFALEVGGGEGGEVGGEGGVGGGEGFADGGEGGDVGVGGGGAAAEVV